MEAKSRILGVYFGFDQRAVESSLIFKGKVSCCHGYLDEEDIPCIRA